MSRICIATCLVWLSYCVTAVAQTAQFDSFVSKIARQYKVDIAIAPELIPRLDSILESGTGASTINELLRHLIKEEHLSYQLIDGNKLMLRLDLDSGVGPQEILIRGTIISQPEGQPLAYAAISLDKSTRGCLADEQGQFNLPVPDSTGTVTIHYLGYSSVTMPVSAFFKGNVEVKMKLQEVPLEEVTIIIPYNEIVQDQETQSLNLKGYYLISEDQLLQGNAERMISALTSYTSFSSDEGIRIRGAESKNSLFLMDGIPVYDPYHFYNIFSPFNGHYFPSVKLYKNNLPVPYGGRIDGMVQLESDRKDAKTHLLFDTDLLLSSLESEITLPNTFTVKLGGRVSHTNMLKEALGDSSVTNFTVPGHYNNENEWISTQQPEFNFYDINAGLTKSLGHGGNLHFSFFSSRDKLSYATHSDLQTTNWNHDIISVQQTYSSLDEWRNLGFAAGIQTRMGTKTTVLADVFSSSYEKEQAYTSMSEDDRDHHHHAMTNKGNQLSDLSSLGFRGLLQKKSTPGSGYQAGLDMEVHEVNFQAKENQTPYVTQTQRETDISAFGEYHQRLFNRLDAYAGSRLTHLNSTKGFYVLPNVRLNYSLPSGFHIKTAFSKNLQPVHELTVENRFGQEVETLVLSEPEEGYPLLKSDKYMIGAGFSSLHLNLDAEVFYKKINGLARVSALMPDPGFNDPTSPDYFYQLFVGDGYTAGFDLILLYKKGKVDGAIYYTLSKIAERYDALFNGNYFSPQEDRRHQLKVSGKYKMGKVETSILLTYKSEAPYLSLVRLEGRGGLNMVDQQNVIRYLPAYFSLDLGVDYSFDILKQPAQFGVSIINSTNHTNIDELRHIGKVPRDGSHGEQSGFFITQQTELLGRTGNVHFRIVF